MQYSKCYSILTQTGADVKEVANAVGMDNRIGSKFLQASVGVFIYRAFIIFRMPSQRFSHFHLLLALRLRRQLLQEGRSLARLFGRVARAPGGRQLLARRRRAQRVPEAPLLHEHRACALQHRLEQEARAARLCVQAKHC